MTGLHARRARGRPRRGAAPLAILIVILAILLIVDNSYSINNM